MFVAGLRVLLEVLAEKELVIMARNFDQSRALQKRAEQLIPGGVNSPVRAFRSVGGEPPFLVRGEGAYVWDADGNQYTRLCRVLGAAHSRPFRT